MAETVTFTFSDGTSFEIEPRPLPPKPVDAPTAADCVSCGACCLEAGYVGVSPTDATPRALTRATKGLNLSKETMSGLGRRCMKRHIGGRCVALEGVVGSNVSCAIYDQRPAVCRQFEAGTPGCLDARERMRNKLASEYRWRGYGADWQETVA